MIIYKVRLDVSVTDLIYKSIIDTEYSSRHNLRRSKITRLILNARICGTTTAESILARREQIVIVNN